jgi:hypothetical protein
VGIRKKTSGVKNEAASRSSATDPHSRRCPRMRTSRETLPTAQAATRRQAVIQPPG